MQCWRRRDRTGLIPSILVPPPSYTRNHVSPQTSPEHEDENEHEDEDEGAIHGDEDESNAVCLAAITSGDISPRLAF